MSVIISAEAGQFCCLSIADLPLSDMEMSRYFLFSKEFFIFELSSRRRRQAKKILKFRAAAADKK
jgi:hypothetical protein